MYHNSIPEEPIKNESGHIAHIRAIIFGDFFEHTDILRYTRLHKHCGIDLLFEEWGPDDNWYPIHFPAIC